MAVAAARAWASRSAGRCGASAVQRLGAGESSPVMAVAAARAWARTAACWSAGRWGASPVSARARE